MDLDGVEPEQQVLAEAPARDFGVQVGIGGGEDAYVHAVGLRRTHALELAGFEDAQQLGLLGRGDVGDLVQEQRAAIGQLETAHAVRARVRKGSLDVAE